MAHRVPPPPRRRAGDRRRAVWALLGRAAPRPSWARRGARRRRRRVGRPGRPCCWPSAAAKARPRARRSLIVRQASRSLLARLRWASSDGLVPVWQGDTLHQIRAATSPRDGHDRAAARVRRQRPARRDARRRRRRLAALYALAPGTSAVVATTGDGVRSRRGALALRGGRAGSPPWRTCAPTRRTGRGVGS